MTVAGVAALGQDRGVAWADSEVFDGNDRPAGHRSKIAINALGGVIGVGSGRLAILHAAEEQFHRVMAFDHLVAALPPVLRLAARDYAGLSIAARAPLGGTTFVALGRSERFGRVVVATFRAEHDFEALCPVHVWTSPAVYDDRVDDLGDIPAVAAHQLEILRGDVPQAAGGTLIIAELAGARLKTEPFRHGMGAGMRPLAAVRAAPVKS